MNYIKRKIPMGSGHWHSSLHIVIISLSVSLNTKQLTLKKKNITVQDKISIVGKLKQKITIRATNVFSFFYLRETVKNNFNYYVKNLGYPQKCTFQRILCV